VSDKSISCLYECAVEAADMQRERRLAASFTTLIQLSGAFLSGDT
jgi:hypothetical protein